MEPSADGAAPGVPSSASVKRRRGRPPKSAAAVAAPPPPRRRQVEQSFEAADDFEDDAVVQSGTKRLRGAAARAAGWRDDLSLSDIVKFNGKLINIAVKKLVERYETHPKSAMVDILVMLFEACGAKYHLDIDSFDETDVDNVVVSLVELAKDGELEEIYNSKQKELKNFKENLASFWDNLVLECQVGPLFDKILFEKCMDYVIALSCTPPRVYRQVASLVGLQLVTSFISVARTLCGQRETAQRQINAEKKKQSDGPLLDSLTKKLSLYHEKIITIEEMMRKIFTGLFMHRYRDVDPDIRMSCIKSLGTWIVSYPSLFLQDLYLKYVGWTLNDKSAAVRKASVLSLQSLYEVDDNIPSLGLFTARFSKRMIELADDIDISVAVSAIGLIKQLLRHQLLTDDELGPLYDLLIDEPPLIRRAIGELVYDHLIAQNIKNAQLGAKDGDESSEVHIGRLLQILREFSDDPILSAYVIDDIWDDMKAMKDWKCIISMLLDESPLTELTTDDATNLVRLLLTSAKKAMGESIVPATFCRKAYHTKAQKEMLEISRKDVTGALMKRYPQLLRKYIADKAKVSLLIDIIPLLNLEIYSLKRQEQNFKSILDLVVDAFFKHGDKNTLRSCIKAVTYCSSEGQAELQDYARSKLKDLEADLVLKVKTAIKDVAAGDDEYSLLVNLKRLYEFQLTNAVPDESLFADMAHIISEIKDMDCEVKSFLLLNMYLQIAWIVRSLDAENPTEMYISEILAKQTLLLEKLYYYCNILYNGPRDGRSSSILSCRICLVISEMWDLFRKSKYTSTKLEALGYQPDFSDVKNFWKLCEQQLTISDETEEEDANEEYIEEANKDVVMIAAAKLVVTNTVPKDFLGPEIVSHFVSDGTSVGEIIKHFISALRKSAGGDDLSVIFLEALKRAYQRHLVEVSSGEGDSQPQTSKSYTDCKDLATRLSATYVGAARSKNKSEIFKIVRDGVSFAFLDAPMQLSFLEVAVAPFVSKLPSTDVLDILRNVEERTQRVNMNEDPSGWRPYQTFVEYLRERSAKADAPTGPDEKEGQAVRRHRGRPRKVRILPGRRAADDHQSSEEESISGSDQHGQQMEDDDDEANQPLIHTFRSSAAKLRSLKLPQHGTGSQGASRTTTPGSAK